METTGEQTIENNDRRDHVSLLTFNVHAWGDAKHKDNFYRVMKVLHALEPDVISFNEVGKYMHMPFTLFLIIIGIFKGF